MESFLWSAVLIGFDEVEIARLGQLVREYGSSCLQLLSGPGANPRDADLVLVKIAGSGGSRVPLFGIPMIGFVSRRADSDTTNSEFEEVLVLSDLTGSWLEHSVKGVMRRHAQNQERRRLESEWVVRERVASVGLLASSIAHEIGTPLGVIRGKAEFQLLRLSADPKQARDLGVIIDQVDRIARYVRQVANLSPSVGRGGVVSVDLCSMMAEVRGLMNPALEAAGIRVTLRGCERGFSRARVEPEAFRQVLLELFSNSIHAIESARRSGLIDEGWIHASYRRVQGRLECCFEDNGVGMREEEIACALHPFQSHKGFGGGHGLGLSVSYRWIQSWNGTLRLESEPGRGTKVVFSLPESEIEVTRNESRPPELE
jgi:signal transduction histidine kinase